MSLRSCEVKVTTSPLPPPPRPPPPPAPPPPPSSCLFNRSSPDAAPFLLAPPCHPPSCHPPSCRPPSCRPPSCHPPLAPHDFPACKPPCHRCSVRRVPFLKNVGAFTACLTVLTRTHAAAHSSKAVLPLLLFPPHPPPSTDVMTAGAPTRRTTSFSRQQSRPRVVDQLGEGCVCSAGASAKTRRVGAAAAAAAAAAAGRAAETGTPPTKRTREKEESNPPRCNLHYPHPT